MDPGTLPEPGSGNWSQHRGADHRRAARRPHPEQGFRTCLGILRLYRGITADRAEAISARAVEIGALNYQSVASILAYRLETRTAQRAADSAPILHPNIRGSRYYH